MKGKVTKREQHTYTHRKRVREASFVHCFTPPNVHKSQVLARLKPETRNFIQVFTWVAETQGPGPSPAALPGALVGSWIE